MDVIKPKEGEILDVELEEKFLAKNRELARDNQKILDENKVLGVNVMGSIGSGKTSLIQGMVRLLKERYRVGVIAGDLTTEIDGDRIKGEGAVVIQINTGKECHLDANLVKNALCKLPLSQIEILFIENVGNLICPAEFPLGAHRKIVVVSVTEGPYIVKKHPFIFKDTDFVVINKIDLSPSMGVYPGKLKEDISGLNKFAEVFETNCVTGEGVEKIVKKLTEDARVMVSKSGSR